MVYPVIFKDGINLKQYKSLPIARKIQKINDLLSIHPYSINQRKTSRYF